MINKTIYAIIIAVLIMIFAVTQTIIDSHDIITTDRNVETEKFDVEYSSKQSMRELEYEIIPLVYNTSEDEEAEQLDNSNEESDEETAISETNIPEDLVLVDTFIATKYCDTGTTATGTQTTESRTLAVNPCDIPYGSHVWLFSEDGDLIGDYYAEDTGGNLLRQHWIVDIFDPSYDSCIEWGARRVSIWIEKDQNDSSVG